MTETREAVARAICRETCARMGEPACWQEVNGGDGLWPNPGCTDCHSMADAALAALSPGGDVGEVPAGAFVNGREHLRRLADHYDFACDAGPLRNCADLHEAERCFGVIEEWAAAAEARIAALTAERDRLAEALSIADEYLGKLQTPGTEPLNSVNTGTTKAMRGQWTAEVRNQAREVWAIIGNMRDHGMTAEEARARAGGGA